MLGKAPAEVAYQFSQVVRGDEFKKSWIAYQQAHLLALGEVLAKVAGDTSALQKQLAGLAQTSDYTAANAEALAECLKLARASQEEQERYAQTAAAQLCAMQDTLLTAFLLFRRPGKAIKMFKSLLKLQKKKVIEF